MPVYTRRCAEKTKIAFVLKKTRRKAAYVRPRIYAA